MLCSRVKNLLSAYCDSELTGADTLQVRQHLRSCDSCRTEHAAIRQVKALIGALPGAEPPHAFDPEHIRTASQSQPRWVRILTQYAAEYAVAAREKLLQPVSLPGARICRDLWHAFSQPLSPAATRFAGQAALGGVAAGAVLYMGLLGQPQKPDTVSAQVPEMVAADESGQMSPGFPSSESGRVSDGVRPVSFSGVDPGVVFPGASFGITTGLEDENAREVSLQGSRDRNDWPMGPNFRRVNYSVDYSPSGASSFRQVYPAPAMANPFAASTAAPRW